MQKQYRYLLAWSFVCLMWNSIPVFAATEVVLDSKTGKVGDTISISASYLGGTTATVASFDIAYDASKVTFTSGSEEDLSSDSLFVNGDTAGQIGVRLVNLKEAALKTTGVFLKLPFKAIATGVTTIEIKNLVAKNGKTNELIATTGKNGTITVAGAPPVGPIVSISPTSLAFGDQAKDVASTAKVITLTNSGTAELTVSNVAASSDFARTNNCAKVAAKANCTINVTFKPTALGARAGNLTITSNATPPTNTVALTGTGIDAAAKPVASLSVTSLSFGDQNIGSNSSRVVSITNTGGADLIIKTVTSSTNEFTVGSPSCVKTLKAGEKCDIQVVFIPTGTGNRNATLNIETNAAGSPHQVPLSGVGTGAAISVPTLSEWAMILMVLSLMGMGFVGIAKNEA